MSGVAVIIFDCDGVLIDSEVIACRADAACLNEIGISISADEIAERYIGVSAPAMFADLEARFGRGLPPDFAETLRRRITQAFAAELKAMPGVEAVLDRIRLPICVASSSDPRRIEDSLAHVGLLSRFHPHIFSASEVARSKPAPDLFLHAAKRMGVDAHACLVIEDSLAGVQAAIAAGMQVIGFAGGSHCHLGFETSLRRAGAFATCGHMKDLLDVIGSRISNG